MGDSTLYLSAGYMELFFVRANKTVPPNSDSVATGDHLLRPIRKQGGAWTQQDQRGPPRIVSKVSWCDHYLHTQENVEVKSRIGGHHLKVPLEIQIRKTQQDISPPQIPWHGIS